MRGVAEHSRSRAPTRRMSASAFAWAAQLGPFIQADWQAGRHALQVQSHSSHRPLRRSTEAVCRKPRKHIKVEDLVLTISLTIWRFPFFPQRLLLSSLSSLLKEGSPPGQARPHLHIHPRLPAEHYPLDSSLLPCSSSILATLCLFPVHRARDHIHSRRLCAGRTYLYLSSHLSFPPPPSHPSWAVPYSRLRTVKRQRSPVTFPSPPSLRVSKHVGSSIRRHAGRHLSTCTYPRHQS